MSLIKLSEPNYLIHSPVRYFFWHKEHWTEKVRRLCEISIMFLLWHFGAQNNLVLKTLLSGFQHLIYFLRFYLFIFRKRVREEERRRETSMCGCASPTGDLARNPGMYPEWESNWQPFGSQACTQSTEPHWPGLSI